MRILLITHFFPPTHTAGTENYTLGLAKTLRLRGHDVVVVCAEGWNIGEEYWNGVSKEDHEGVTVYRIHLNWTKASNSNKVLYDSSQVEAWFDRFLSKTKFELTHVTSLYTFGVGVLRSVKRAGIPLVLTLTDFWFLCPSIQLLRSDNSLCDGITTPWQCHSCLLGKSQFFNRLQKVSLPNAVNARIWGTLSQIATVSNQRGFQGLLLNMDQRKKTMKEAISLPDVLISPSRLVKDLFAKHFSEPIRVVNHGHDLLWLTDYAGKSKSEKLRFGYLGQIQRTKGVHLLIEGFIKSNLADHARLDIWGNEAKDPEYTQELLSKIKGNPSIILHGKYEHGKLASIMSDMDVIVVPSTWYENAPLVIQEAFATATPVIASNIGGMAEFVLNGVNGLLFERGNPDDLARQMIRVVREPGLLDELSRTMPTVKTFEDEMIELDCIYKDLIKQAHL